MHDPVASSRCYRFIPYKHYSKYLRKGCEQLGNRSATALYSMWNYRCGKCPHKVKRKDSCIISSAVCKYLRIEYLILSALPWWISRVTLSSFSLFLELHFLHESIIIGGWKCKSNLKIILNAYNLPMSLSQTKVYLVLKISWNLDSEFGFVCIDLY